MKHKFRLRDIETDGYYFIDHEGLYWHSGHFWFNEEMLQQVCNNGSLAVNLFGKKLGVKKLRKKARPCKIKLLKEVMPF